jgi:hypothetical protein
VAADPRRVLIGQKTMEKALTKTVHPVETSMEDDDNRTSIALLFSRRCRFKCQPDQQTFIQLKYINWSQQAV